MNYQSYLDKLRVMVINEELIDQVIDDEGNLLPIEDIVRAAKSSPTCIVFYDFMGEVDLSIIESLLD